MAQINSFLLLSQKIKIVICCHFCLLGIFVQTSLSYIAYSWIKYGFFQDGELDEDEDEEEEMEIGSSDSESEDGKSQGSWTV